MVPYKVYNAVIVVEWADKYTYQVILWNLLKHSCLKSNKMCHFLGHNGLFQIMANDNDFQLWTL